MAIAISMCTSLLSYFCSRRAPVSLFTTLPSTLILPYQTYSRLFQEIAYGEYAEPGKQAHAHMITSGFAPTMFVSNCLINMYVRTMNLCHARKVFDKMPEHDIVSWSTIIAGYAQFGLMTDANYLFEAMHDRDIISWNSMMSGYVNDGNSQVAMIFFGRMRQTGIEPDRTSFAIILKACATLDEILFGICFHCLSLKMGFGSDVFTGSALVDMYAKCRKLCEAWQVFCEMPERNWVSWSALIAGYTQNDQPWDALELFVEMRREGVGVSQSIYASIFRCCASVKNEELGLAVHGHAFKANFGSDTIVGTSIVDMYAKCGNLDTAREMFDWLPIHTLQSLNAMIVGYVRNHQGLDALKLFTKMHSSTPIVDEITLSGILSACAGVGGFYQGLQIHALVIKTNHDSEICVANSLLDMYAKCRYLNAACRVFEEMDRRDAVSWNAIVAAYEQNGCVNKTLLYFNEMIRISMDPDEFTYGSILKVCANLRSVNLGMEVHCCIIKSALGSDLFVCGALIDMYNKCGCSKDALLIHDRVGKQSLMSWNSVISGMLQERESEDAQSFFYKMLDAGLKPDNFSYATILDSCANLASISVGRQIHVQIIKEKLQHDLFISSTLVDMYAKCGCMHDSRQVFNKMARKDTVTWNAMICGYAQHGLGEEALAVFELMLQDNVRPNHATVVSVLRACAYVGLFSDGERHFQMMRSQYGLDPQLEHYACMVDIYGRWGKVFQALRLIENMPVQADAVVWRTLLCACKTYGNVLVAEKAAKNIQRLDPQDSSVYVLLSCVYAEANMWTQVSNMRKMMRQKGLKKEPGCSWIEVTNELHAFLVGDVAHPRSETIYWTLNNLITEMKIAGYVLSHIDVCHE